MVFAIVRLHFTVSCCKFLFNVVVAYQDGCEGDLPLINSIFPGGQMFMSSRRAFILAAWAGTATGLNKSLAIPAPWLAAKSFAALQ